MVTLRRQDDQISEGSENKKKENERNGLLGKKQGLKDGYPRNFLKSPQTTTKKKKKKEKKG